MEIPCDKTGRLGIKFALENRSFTWLLGGHLCACVPKNTDTQHPEAVEVKWHGCRPRRTSTPLLPGHQHENPHQQHQWKTCKLIMFQSMCFWVLHVCCLCSVRKKSISVLFMVCSVQYRNIWQHFSLIEPMGICCIFHCAVHFMLSI